MIQEDFYSLLSSLMSPQIADIYPLVVPQEVAYPAVRYARVTSQRDTNFDEVENFVRTVMQVDSYAETYNQSLDLSESVKAGLNGYKGGRIHLIRLDYEVDTLEDETNLYRVLQQFSIWHTEQ